MPSKIAEKELTKFLKKELHVQLDLKLKKLGFLPLSEEKILPGVKFDLWTKERKKYGCFSIWEIEVHSGHHECNITKLDQILKYWWKPKIFMFHIFSPYYYENEKERCNELAEELRSGHPRKFVYKQINITIGYERFERIIDAFQSNKYSAKQHYGLELKKEVRSVVRETIAKL
jgi:hypothetical protein